MWPCKNFTLNTAFLLSQSKVIGKYGLFVCFVVFLKTLEIRLLFLDHSVVIYYNL